MSLDDAFNAFLDNHARQTTALESLVDAINEIAISLHSLDVSVLGALEVKDFAEEASK